MDEVKLLTLVGDVSKYEALLVDGSGFEYCKRIDKRISGERPGVRGAVLGHGRVVRLFRVIWSSDEAHLVDA